MVPQPAQKQTNKERNNDGTITVNQKQLELVNYADNVLGRAPYYTSSTSSIDDIHMVHKIPDT